MLTCIQLLPWARLNRNTLMRQAVLLFSHGSHGESLVERRVANGLNLLDRQIRTLARAGMEHINARAEKGAAPTLTPITQKLPVKVEFLTHGAAPALSDPEAPYLLLLGGKVHHHSSLSGWLSHLDTTPSLAKPYPPHTLSKGASYIRHTQSLAKPKIAQKPFPAARFAVIPSAVPRFGRGEQPWRPAGGTKRLEQLRFDVLNEDPLAAR